jgi:hypothetical protein
VVLRDGIGEVVAEVLATVVINRLDKLSHSQSIQLSSRTTYRKTSSPDGTRFSLLGSFFLRLNSASAIKLPVPVGPVIASTSGARSFVDVRLSSRQ